MADGRCSTGCTQLLLWLHFEVHLDSPLSLNLRTAPMGLLVPPGGCRHRHLWPRACGRRVASWHFLDIVGRS
jgi:hypothetical protein